MKLLAEDADVPLEWYQQLGLFLDQWGSLIVAAAALALSGWALWKGRTPKPSWSFTSKTNEVGGAQPRVWVYASFTNDGPGRAERVGWQFRYPDSPWGDPQYPDETVNLDRGGMTTFTVIETDGTAADNIPDGPYEIKVLYRTLPNTAKVRKKSFTFDK